ncbi:MAG: HNH endonuclease [Clostridiales bacterium]|nr:HNH endonuclease [Clostridiales bacterium]
MTIDHFVPRSLGGTFDRRNLMPLCKDCNKERKSDYIDPRNTTKTRVKRLSRIAISTGRI